VQLNVPAKHNVSNALAAASAAYALGIQAEQIASGLALFSGVGGRLQVVKGLGGATVLNDSYNANPGSVRAAIDTLMDFNGKTYLVLGDIGELGDSSLSAHAELGRYAKQAGVDQLYTVGEFSEQATHSFGAGAIHWPDQQSLIDALKQQLQVNTTVLVKGSRSAAMELVVEQLKFTQ
jgi:UDP-N-acetylmuramoyl-tripeptide--D-alanyl-D-alanine ligase